MYMNTKQTGIEEEREMKREEAQREAHVDFLNMKEEEERWRRKSENKTARQNTV